MAADVLLILNVLILKSCLNRKKFHLRFKMGKMIDSMPSFLRSEEEVTKPKKTHPDGPKYLNEKE